MKVTRFLTVFLCAFLIFGLNLASAKPPSQAEPSIGSAVLDDASVYKIVSDGFGPYTDIRLEDGEDLIEVEFSRGKLEKTTATFGRHCMLSTVEQSGRGVIPDFTISPNDVVHAAVGSIEETMLDALIEALAGDPTTDPNSIYRFRVRTNTLGKDLQIRVDSVIWGVNWGMLRDDEGIVEADLLKYYFFSGPDCTNDNQDDNTLQYNLRYEGVDIVETDPGKSWTIEPFPGPATLYVFRGQAKKSRPKVYNPVDLVTYTDGLPLKYEITLPEAGPAPGRFTTLTTCWGDIKEN